MSDEPRLTGVPGYDHPHPYASLAHPVVYMGALADRPGCVIGKYIPGLSRRLPKRWSTAWGNGRQISPGRSSDD